MGSLRIGLYLGAALPALVSGIYLSFQDDTRNKIGSLQWGPLLYVYGALLIPVLFCFLIGVNIWAWTQARIEYQLIFELDAQTVESQPYGEFPAFLLMTLCLAFWFSFSRFGVNDHIAPTTWPVIWMGTMLVLLFNPFPIFSYYPRAWVIKKTARLPISNFRRVHFTDFWLSDQFCSLAFSLSAMYFVGCTYAYEWADPFQQCLLATPRWPIPCVLSMLPDILRFTQCVKRFCDCGSKTHLVNAGKYVSGLFTYAAYYIWRHGGPDNYTGGETVAFNIWFALFCFTSALHSIYTIGWDLMVDWSLLQYNGARPLLRSELMYTSWPSLYYVAMIVDILIRFIWVIFIPYDPSIFPLRSFIAAFLEMLRRIQWNFFRIENEHLGNLDQYVLPKTYCKKNSEEWGCAA